MKRRKSALAFNRPEWLTEHELAEPVCVTMGWGVLCPLQLYARYCVLTLIDADAAPSLLPGRW